MSKGEDKEESMELIACEALECARNAFQRYVSKVHNIDPAYFDYRFTAWVVDDNLEHRLARIEIERELKD